MVFAVGECEFTVGECEFALTVCEARNIKGSILVKELQIVSLIHFHQAWLLTLADPCKHLT